MEHSPFRSDFVKKKFFQLKKKKENQRRSAILLGRVAFKKKIKSSTHQSRTGLLSLMPLSFSVYFFIFVVVVVVVVVAGVALN